MRMADHRFHRLDFFLKPSEVVRGPWVVQSPTHHFEGYVLPGFRVTSSLDPAVSRARVCVDVCASENTKSRYRSAGGAL